MRERIEAMKNKILLTKIQRFSLHDGPGIRTTCFVKGCSVRCPWCCNPENWSSEIQNYVKNGQKGVYGVLYSDEQLYIEVIKDKAFYVGETSNFSITSADDIDLLPGGVTFSGGECLLEIHSLEPLIRRLNQEQIHTVVETSLFVPPNNIQLAKEIIDFFYVDVKVLDEKKCQTILHGNLNLYLSNLDALLNSGKPVVIRIPVIGGYTDDVVNRRKVVDLISNYTDKILKVELMKEHHLGIGKYQSLSACNVGYPTPNYKGVSDDLIMQYKFEIENKIGNRIPVEVCKI